MIGRGPFVAFEGVEGCGKSTQVRLLAQYLRSRGMEVIETVEPGGTPVGQHIRTLLLTPGNDMDALTETFLFSASRREHCRQVVLPALTAGKVVITDRYYLSTMAYQACGGDVSLRIIDQMTEWATEGLDPDLWLVIDIDTAEGRRRKTGDTPDRIEQRDMAFHDRVRAGFLELTKDRASTAVVIDGMADEVLVTACIIEAVRERLGIG